jgi:hypothetical protein
MLADGVPSNGRGVAGAWITSVDAVIFGAFVGVKGTKGEEGVEGVVRVVGGGVCAR